MNPPFPLIYNNNKKELKFMSHSFFLITFLVIFGIAVFTILFKVVSNIVLSFSSKGKAKSNHRYGCKSYSHTFASNSNDDFMRQAEMMHDIAHREHIRMHNEFMNNSISTHDNFINSSISTNNDFMNNSMNNFM